MQLPLLLVLVLLLLDVVLVEVPPVPVLDEDVGPLLVVPLVDELPLAPPVPLPWVVLPQATTRETAARSEVTGSVPE